MGKGGIVFLLLGAGALGLYLSRKAGAGEKLKFLPQGINITGKFPNYKVFYLLDVTNPTQVNLDINNVFADVSVNDNILGKVEDTKGFKILPATTTKLSLPVIIGTGNIPALAIIVSKLFKGEKLIARVDGNINAQGFDYPVKNEFKISKV